MVYAPELVDEEKGSAEKGKKAVKSASFEEFLKKHEKELERIKEEINEELKKKGSRERISKAGVEDIAYLLWLWEELDSDEKVLKAVKKLLKKLLDWGGFLASLFKKD